jgi:hypothetical protein
MNNTAKETPHLFLLGSLIAQNLKLVESDAQLLLHLTGALARSLNEVDETIALILDQVIELLEIPDTGHDGAPHLLEVPSNHLLQHALLLALLQLLNLLHQAFVREAGWE